MLKKSLLLFIITAQLSYAETCPTPTQLHAHQLNDWQLFDIDNGSRITGKALDEYLKHTQQFALAEWMDDAPEGSGHCYYYGKNPNTDYLHAFLAKQDLITDPNAPAWFDTVTNTRQCISGINQCRFVKK